MESIDAPAARFVAVVAGLPLYVGGCLAVVILPLNAMNNPTQDLSFGVVVGLTTFFLGVALLSVGSTKYSRPRLAACLLVPPLFLAGAIAVMPGTLAPWLIVTCFLAAGVTMHVLLRSWARRVP